MRATYMSADLTSLEEEGPAMHDNVKMLLVIMRKRPHLPQLHEQRMVYVIRAHCNAHGPVAMDTGLWRGLAADMMLRSRSMSHCTAVAQVSWH